MALISCQNGNDASQEMQSIDQEIKDNDQPLLRHVVLFNFKDSTDAIKLQEIENAFAALPSKISEIKDFEWGINNSPEGLDKGLSHCFLVTFGSEEDREKYLPHPAHQEFVTLIGPYVEDVTVVDYWTK
jgi:hypothetical protein